MKVKLFLSVFFLAIPSVSCSTDDNSEPTKDDIIGTWGVFEYLEEDGRVIEVDSRLSENQITFHSNGTLTGSFIEGNINWENVGNGIYEATGEGAPEGEADVLELLNNGVLKTEYGNGEATFFEKVKD